MKGRKPVPTALRVIAGNPSGRPLPKNEPVPIGDLLAPPAFLTADQRATWIYALDHAPKGLLRLLDRDLFLGWVRAVCEVEQAERELQTSGPVVQQGGAERTTTNKDGIVTKTVRSGNLVPSPWTKIRDSAYQRMMKAISELGFSPTSRSRITLAGGGAQEKNRFANNATKKA